MNSSLDTAHRGSYLGWLGGGRNPFELFRKQLLKVLGKVAVFDAVSHAKKLRLGVLPATGWAPKVFGGESPWNAGGGSPEFVPGKLQWRSQSMACLRLSGLLRGVRHPRVLRLKKACSK